jgi:hypothetical protein
MRLFFGKQKPKPVDLINGAIRGQVSVSRFKIGRDDAEKIRLAEARGGQAEGLRVVLEILRKKHRAQ